MNTQTDREAKASPKLAATVASFDGRRQAVLDILGREGYIPLKIAQLSHALHVKKDQKNEFNTFITALIRSGDIYMDKNSKLQLPAAVGVYKGVFSATMKNFGFVAVEGMDKDFFVPQERLGGAMHKDTVLVRTSLKKSSDRAEIIKVVERGFSTLVGTVVKSGNGFVLHPNNPLLGLVFIPAEKSKGLADGHKVVARITKYPKKPALPDSKTHPAKKTKPLKSAKTTLIQGEIIEILGHANDPGVDILSIIKEAGIPTAFEPEVLQEAEVVSDPEAFEKATQSASREDLRHWDIITIDGEDAKDLDDGISLTLSAQGIYTLGVHIADVTHYVTHGSALDKSALDRGTSVYLVDRVIPMLPHTLSNGICSLNAGEDRLALSVIMDMDSSGQVVSHRICESIIHVKKRMSYDKVATLLEPAEPTEGEAVTPPALSGYEPYRETLEQMARLAKQLADNRTAKGALDFGLNETKVILDEAGQVIDIVSRERNVATKLIEAFMLAANETVATEYYWLQQPFLYRNHPEPEREKIEALNLFIAPFGYRIKGNTTHPKDFQALLNKIADKPEGQVISHVVLRSLKQATYSHDSQGHFGLATRYYCHFTSPIRRYPDLFIHRVIKAHLRGDIALLRQMTGLAHDIGLSSSRLERRAETAEREVLSYKKAQYMADKVGQVFTGIISSVTSWGIYVTLPNTVEGMVRMSDVTDDSYLYDKNQHRYLGKRTHKTYALGDTVHVQVIGTGSGKVDFMLVAEGFSEDQDHDN